MDLVVDIADTSIPGGIADIISDGLGVINSDDFSEAIVNSAFGNIKSGMDGKDSYSGSDKFIDNTFLPLCGN